MGEPQDCGHAREWDQRDKGCLLCDLISRYPKLQAALDRKRMKKMGGKGEEYVAPVPSDWNYERIKKTAARVAQVVVGQMKLQTMMAKFEEVPETGGCSDTFVVEGVTYFMTVARR